MIIFTVPMLKNITIYGSQSKKMYECFLGQPSEHALFLPLYEAWPSRLWTKHFFSLFGYRLKLKSQLT